MKKIAIFSVIFILLANQSLAFSQDYTPNDTNKVYQTYFDLLNIEPSWSNELQVNKEVVVAVLDSGVDLDHPDLVNNIWVNSGEIAGDGIDNDFNSFIDDVNGWDFVYSDSNPEPDLTGNFDATAVHHGTVISGIIAAESNNSQGITGIAPKAKIMPLKILDNKGSGNILVLSQAIDYAVENGADIINLSLVGDQYNDTLQNSVINAYNKGVLIIAASGNESSQGISLDIDPRYPVCDIDEVNRVIGVAAVNQQSKMATYSNFGEQCIDISAPGSKFYSTLYQNPQHVDFLRFYGNGWSGTSVAAPTVAGTAALLKMHYPTLRPYDLQTILMTSSKNLQASNPLHHVDLGSGLLDVGAALNLAASYDQGSKIILAPEPGLSPEILIMDNEGNLESFFLAYADKFKGGVNIAIGDVNNDGQDEIITAPMAGGGPHIRVFSKGGSLVSEFFAYSARFTGGVNIAVGDLNNDGNLEIITAPMAGGGPHIRVFNLQGQVLSEFFAYDSHFHGGVNIAIGDVNNDGQDEIVTAPYSNHSPEIKVFDFEHRMKSRFLPYSSSMTQGVKLAVGDVNNDDWPEIITVPNRGAPELKVMSMKGRVKSEFLPYSKYLTSGIKVVAGDISGDGLPEILTLPNSGDTSLLNIYDANGLKKSSFYLRHPQDKNGYNFGVLVK